MNTLSITNWRRHLSIFLFIILSAIGTFHIFIGLFFLISSNNTLFSEILYSDTILTKVSNQLGNTTTVILFGIVEILSGYLLYSYNKSKTKALLGISMNTVLFTTTLSFNHVSKHATLASEALFKNALLIKDYTLLGIGLLLFGYMITNHEN
jgi:uncharacterized membrane protein YkgB